MYLADSYIVCINCAYNVYTQFKWVHFTEARYSTIVMCDSIGGSLLCKRRRDSPTANRVQDTPKAIDGGAGADSLAGGQGVHMVDHVSVLHHDYAIRLALHPDPTVAIPVAEPTQIVSLAPLVTRRLAWQCSA